MTGLEGKELFKKSGELASGWWLRKCSRIAQPALDVVAQRDPNQKSPFNWLTALSAIKDLTIW